MKRLLLATQASKACGNPGVWFVEILDTEEIDLGFVESIQKY
jgi:hypothetical protein